MHWTILLLLMLSLNGIFVIRVGFLQNKASAFLTQISKNYREKDFSGQTEFLLFDQPLPYLPQRLDYGIKPGPAQSPAIALCLFKEILPDTQLNTLCAN